MPAWGVAGGGALNDQQVQNLVDYIQSIQISPDEAQQAAKDELAKMMAEKNPDGSPKWASEGEALFIMLPPDVRERMEEARQRRQEH